ncbi:MAG: hypothetical protein QOE04_1462 [Mycobacterium sp.]|nr:hypothetical protein [Mycobacterium sp.]
MKVRQSASLVAGVCTLCVAASGSVTPLPVAAAAGTSGAPVSRPFELTASQGVLIDSINVASLPAQNFITALTAVAGAAGGSGGNASLQALPNLLYSQLVAGTLTQASANTAINAALANEQTALTALGATPQKIITTDLAAISTLLADFGLGAIGATAAATPFKEASVASGATAADAGGTSVNLANALSLPLQNFVTVLNALAGAAGGGNGLGGGGATSLQALPNLLYSQLVAGTLTEASATTAINAALTNEQTALGNLAATPGAIVTHDTAVLAALFSGLGTSSVTANSTLAGPTVNTAAVTTNAAADPTGIAVDFTNVASLPLQNFVTALAAVSGAAGGSGGAVNGSGAASLQALPNLLYGQLVAGTLTEASATKAINAAVALEQTALTNLAATPQNIINTDVAAIKKLVGDFGGTSTQAAGTSTNAITSNVKTKAITSKVNTPSITSDVKTPVADAAVTTKSSVAADPGTNSGSTTPARHAKSAGGGAVANAIKAVTGGSKGSYVGKHRAGSDGASSSHSSDAGSKGGSKGGK